MFPISISFSKARRGKSGPQAYFSWIIICMLNMHINYTFMSKKQTKQKNLKTLLWNKLTLLIYTNLDGLLAIEFVNLTQTSHQFKNNLVQKIQMACPRHLVTEHPVTVAGIGAKEMRNIRVVLKWYFPLTSGMAGREPWRFSREEKRGPSTHSDKEMVSEVRFKGWGRAIQGKRRGRRHFC